jgi:hypothetical protein
VDAHGHVQVVQVVIVLFSVAYGIPLVTDFRGLAGRSLDRLRADRVTGRFYARMPVWAMRAFGVWIISAGVGQFFLLRYMP